MQQDPRCSGSCIIPLPPRLEPHYGHATALDGLTVLGGTERGADANRWEGFPRAPSAWQKPKVSVAYQAETFGLTVRAIRMSSLG
jgi:hypothetical protein